MNIKQKFNSIDQSKLEAKQVEILKSIKEKTNDFKTKDQEVVSKIDMALDKIIGALKEKNPEAIKSTSKTKTPKSGSGSKRTLFSIAKEIRKSNETWEEAKSRAKKIMSEESQQTTQKMKSETEKLLAFIKRKKELDGLSGTSVKKDSKIEALPKGRRVSKKGWKNQYGESEGGRVYYENRDNRTDRLAPSFADKIYLAEGGYADKGVYVETLDEEIDLSDDAKVRARKTQQGGNKSFGERREMHGASPEALAFGNGGYVVIAKSEKGGGFVMSKPTSKLKAEKLKSLLPKIDGESNEVMTLNKASKLSGLVGKEYLKYADGGAIIGTPETPLARGLDIDYTGLVGETGGMSAGELFARGGGVGDNVLGLKKGDIYKVIDEQHLESEKTFTFIDYEDRFNRIVLKSLRFPPNPKIKNDFIYISEVSSDGIKVLNDEEIGQVISRKYKNFVENNYELGGGIPNNYEGRTPEDIWNNLTLKQREHFLKDHFLSNSEKFLDRVVYSKILNQISETKYKDWNNLPRLAQMEFERHVFMGQYAYGGRTRDRKFKNYSQKHEVRYSKDKPHRRGYGYEEGGFMADVYNGGGETRKMQLGEPVIYKGETWEVTQKDGVVGLTSMRQGAWGSDFPFVPISKIDARREVKDFYGNEVRIPYLVEDFEEGGFMTDPNFGDFQNGVYNEGGGTLNKTKLFTKEDDQKLFKQHKFGKDLTKQDAVLKIYQNVGNIHYYIINADPKDPNNLLAIIQDDISGETDVDFVRRSSIETFAERVGGTTRTINYTPINAEKLYNWLQRGNYYAKGGGVYKESKYLTKEQWEKWNDYVKTGKIDGKKENNMFTVARHIGVSVSQINAYEREIYNKYETGGGVGKKKTQKELRNEYLEKLGSKEADVWDKIGAESGSDIRNSDKMLKAYAEGVEEMLQKEGVGKGSFDQEDYDFYTDENWHLFNEFLVWNGYYEPEMIKTEKEWREDRFKDPKYKNYVANPSVITIKRVKDEDKIELGYGFDIIVEKHSYTSGESTYGAILHYANKLFKFFTVIPNASKKEAINNVYDYIKTLKVSDKIAENSPKKGDYSVYYNDRGGEHRKTFDTKFDAQEFINMVNYLTENSKPKSSKYIVKADIKEVKVKTDAGYEYTFKGSDVLNGVNVLEKGSLLKNNATYVAKRNIIHVELKNGEKVKPVNGYWIKKDAKGELFKPEKKEEYKVMSNQAIFPKRGVGTYWYVENSKGQTINNTTGKPYKGKEMTNYYFLNEEGAKKFAEKLNNSSFEGGGKTTFKEKATAIAKNFEGKKVEPKYQKEYGKTYDKAEAKEVGNKIAGSQKAKYDSKMSGGGSTKRGGAMQLAKQIRKDGESWQSALKRANEQMRKK